MSPAERTGERLVLASIAALVLVRFFTEVAPVLPRAANFVDIPIVLALSIAALVHPAVHRRQKPHRAGCRSLDSHSLSAAPWRPSSIFPASTSPRRWSSSTESSARWLSTARSGRLWPVGRALAASRLLVALGLIQIVVVAGIDIPRFASSEQSRRHRRHVRHQRLSARLFPASLRNSSRRHVHPRAAAACARLRRC